MPVLLACWPCRGAAAPLLLGFQRHLTSSTPIKSSSGRNQRDSNLLFYGDQLSYGYLLSTVPSGCTIRVSLGRLASCRKTSAQEVPPTDHREYLLCRN